MCRKWYTTCGALAPRTGFELAACRLGDFGTVSYRVVHNALKRLKNRMITGFLSEPSVVQYCLILCYYFGYRCRVLAILLAKQLLSRSHKRCFGYSIFWIFIKTKTYKEAGSSRLLVS